MSASSSTGPVPGTSHSNPAASSDSSHGGTSAVPPQIDIHALAAALQQATQKNAQGSSSSSGNVPGSSNGSGNANTHANANVNGNTTDVQAILMEMQKLKNERDTFLKNLEEEKQKSKILVEDKKKEMESFLGGIAEYVNGLEGVKDPESKKKFLDGIKSMANHGVPNGIFDIMVSASALNQQHIKTIEVLTQGYNMLKNKYEGAGGQFSSEESRVVIPNESVGEKRKSLHDGSFNTHKAPLGMWDAFGEDIAKFGYHDTKDVFVSDTPNMGSSSSRL